MNKLVKKYKEIINEEIICWGDYEVGITDKLCAEECRKIAIEFAKELMKSKVKIAREGIIGGAKVVYSITPSEYTLMEGELIKNGDELFNEFLKSYGQGE
jgi:hypothetical protein